LLISQLKTLQDYLGEFHDLVVQQEYLLHISDELAASGKVKQGTLLSIGSLIGSLEDEKVRLTSAFGEVFNQFKSQENRALFEELFRIEERA
jgi:CHAD domain-containing protein